MTDDEAFVRAVVERPGDDTPRLVYADWLDDHDDPARAAYLRAELVWANAPEGEPRTKAAREKKRLASAATALGGPLPPLWVYRVGRPPLGACFRNPVFEFTGPPLTAAHLDEGRTRLQPRVIPDEYAAFLLNYNGGLLRDLEVVECCACFARLPAGPSGRGDFDAGSPVRGSAEVPTIDEIAGDLYHPHTGSGGGWCANSIFEDCLPVAFAWADYEKLDFVLLRQRTRRGKPHQRVLSYRNPLGNEVECDGEDFDEYFADFNPERHADIVADGFLHLLADIDR